MIESSLETKHVVQDWLYLSFNTKQTYQSKQFGLNANDQYIMSCSLFQRVVYWVKLVGVKSSLVEGTGRTASALNFRKAFRMSTTNSRCTAGVQQVYSRCRVRYNPLVHYLPR